MLTPPPAAEMGTLSLQLEISGFPASSIHLNQFQHHISCHSRHLVDTTLEKRHGKVYAELLFFKQEDLEASLARLGSAKYRKTRLTFQVLSGSAHTAIGRKVHHVSLLVSKLPDTGFDGLKHHIQSHVGGTVVGMEISKSKRRGRKAICQLRLVRDPSPGLERLKHARFRGYNLHVQLLSHSMEGSDAAPIKDLATTSSMVGMSASSSLGRRLQVVKGISTDFCHYVLSDADRIYRARRQNDMDNLFDDYMMGVLLQNGRCQQNREHQ